MSPKADNIYIVGMESIHSISHDITAKNNKTVKGISGTKSLHLISHDITAKD